MDLNTKFSRTPPSVYTIWVIPDSLTKRVYFIVSHGGDCHHGVTISVVSDKDVRFTSRF